MTKKPLTAKQLGEALERARLEVAPELLRNLAVSMASFISQIDTSSPDVAAYIERRLFPLIPMMRTDERVRFAVECAVKDARPGSIAAPTLPVPVESPDHYALWDEITSALVKPMDTKSWTQLREQLVAGCPGSSRIAADEIEALRTIVALQRKVIEEADKMRADLVRALDGIAAVSAYDAARASLKEKP